MMYRQITHARKGYVPVFAMITMLLAMVACIFAISASAPNQALANEYKTWIGEDYYFMEEYVEDAAGHEQLEVTIYKKNGTPTAYKHVFESNGVAGAGLFGGTYADHRMMYLTYRSDTAQLWCCSPYDGFSFTRGINMQMTDMCVDQLEDYPGTLLVTETYEDKSSPTGYTASSCFVDTAGKEVMALPAFPSKFDLLSSSLSKEEGTDLAKVKFDLNAADPSAEFYVNLSSKLYVRAEGREWEYAVNTKLDKTHLMGFSSADHDVVVYDLKLKKLATISANKSTTEIDCSYDSTAKCYVLVEHKVKNGIYKTLNARCYNSSFKYLGKSLSQQIANFSTSKSRYTYTGKAIKPGFKIKIGSKTLVKGKDYKLVGYKSNKKVGMGTITVQGMSPYYGKAAYSFPILPKKVEVKKVVPIKGGFKISWKPLPKSQTSGYKIYMKPSKNHVGSPEFVYAMSKGAKTSSKTVKNLKKGQTWYVTVVAMMPVHSLHSEESKSYKVTIK